VNVWPVNRRFRLSLWLAFSRPMIPAALLSGSAASAAASAALSTLSASLARLEADVDVAGTQTLQEQMLEMLEWKAVASQELAALKSDVAELRLAQAGASGDAAHGNVLDGATSAADGPSAARPAPIVPASPKSHDDELREAALADELLETDRRQKLAGSYVLELSGGGSDSIGRAKGGRGGARGRGFVPHQPKPAIRPRSAPPGSSIDTTGHSAAQRGFGRPGLQSPIQSLHSPPIVPQV